MDRKHPLLAASLSLVAGSMALAFGSIMLGRQVRHLDHLPLFNGLALGMLFLVVAGLAVGAIGTWKARGKSLPLWLTNALALVVVSLYLFDA